jgi:putative spermidine/putrescine transport system substrate-binding protein
MIRQLRVVTAVAAVGALVTILAGCGSSTPAASNNASSNGSKRFPASEYPPSTFKGLSGSVVMYDPNGGPTTAATMATIFKDFTDLTGVKVVPDYNATSTKLFAGLQAGQAPWSLAQVGTKADIARLEAQQHLMPLDPAVVPLNKLDKGSYDKYSIPYERYGFVLTWNTKKWPLSGPHPETMADLYDTKKFPGKRCLFKSAQYGWTLESALIADGVSPSSRYPLDVKRAFAKLDTIKNDIVWWDSGSQSIQYLENGECDLGITWSARPYDAVQSDNAPLAITWKQGGYTSGYIAIPKSAPNPKAAQALLAMWILDTPGQIRFVSKIPYPSPITSISLSEYPAKVRPYLPAGSNLKDATAEDEDYYTKELASLTRQFTAWLGH